MTHKPQIFLVLKVNPGHLFCWGNAALIDATIKYNRKLGAPADAFVVEYDPIWLSQFRPSTPRDEAGRHHAG